MLRDRFGVSQRRACTVVGLHRSTMRLEPLPISTDEAELRAWLRRFSTDRPRWGWRRAAKMARRAGWQVNNKRIRRLWRAEGLRVPQRRRKKPLTGIGVVVGAMSPIRPNVIWAMDFQFDTTADGRTLKLLNVIDEFTREALAIEVDRSIDADGSVDVLDRLASTHGAPTYVRFDNGPEFVAHAVNDWCRFNSAASLFIDPAHPGRTPGSSHSTAACATNCSTRGDSTHCWKPASSSKTGAATTTPTGLTPPTGNSPPPSSLYSGPRPTNPKSHSDWTTDWVPLKGRSPERLSVSPNLTLVY